MKLNEPKVQTFLVAGEHARLHSDLPPALMREHSSHSFEFSAAQVEVWVCVGGKGPGVLTYFCVRGTRTGKCGGVEALV